MPRPGPVDRPAVTPYHFVKGGPWPTKRSRMTWMKLAEPGWLMLLALAPLPWLWERARPRIAWPSLDGFGRGRPSGLRALRHLPPLLRGLAIACLAVALARPQAVGGRMRIAGQGVAIVVALDHSSSMNAT